MTLSTLKDSLLSHLTKLVLNKLTAWSSIVLLPLVYLYFQYLDSAFVDQKTRKAILLCMAIIIGISFLLLLFLLRLYLTYGRFREAYGSFWDKKFNMRCMKCHKPIKNSSYDVTIFFCSNCNEKYPLRTADGNPLTKQQAIDLMTKK